MIWSFDPVMLELGSLELRWYGFCFMLAFLTGWLLMRVLMRRATYPSEWAADLVVYAIIGGVGGARLLHCLVYDPAYYMEKPLRILQVHHGGLASHGALLGLALVVVFFARRRRIPLLKLLDMVAAVVLPGAGLIRIANFLNSEILGTPTTLPWGIVFKRVDLVARHPVMLYEALGYFLLAFFLWWLYHRSNSQPGRVTGWLLVLVFGLRFVLEQFKEALAAWTLPPFSAGQWLSVLPVLVGIALLWQLRSQRKLRTQDVEEG